MLVKLGLDQTRFIIRLPGVNTQSLIDENIMEAMIYKAAREHIFSCTPDLKEGAKYWKCKKGATTKSIYPLEGGSVLTVALGWSTKAKYHFMTVQFNPSKLTTVAAIEIQAAFSCMFDGGYYEFYDRAECSYVETALDVFGAKMSDYLFFDTRLKSFSDIFEAHGTLYLGSKSSSRFITVYDKAKEIADKGGPVVKEEWLRIEPHLCLNVAAGGVVNLPCAFATLKVIDKKKLAAITHSITVNAFRDRVFKQGMQPQAAYLAAPEKKGLLAGLHNAAPDWYHPTALWKMFPSAASRITPAGVQAIAKSPHLTTPVLPPSAHWSHMALEIASV